MGKRQPMVECEAFSDTLSWIFGTPLRVVAPQDAYEEAVAAGIFAPNEVTVNQAPADTGTEEEEKPDGS